MIPDSLAALMAADELFTVNLFGTLAGLALTASAFAFTAVSVLEDATARYLTRIDNREDLSASERASNVEHREDARRLQKAKDSVLEAGNKLLAAMVFFVIGLFVSLGFDSWGEQALEAAREALKYETAIAWGASEAGVAGTMLLAGLFLLLAGAGGLHAALNALGNKKEVEGLGRFLPRFVTSLLRGKTRRSG